MDDQIIFEKIDAFWDRCILCGKKISARSAGGRASHGRRHVRKGEAVEKHTGIPFYNTKFVVKK